MCKLIGLFTAGLYTRKEFYIRFLVVAYRKTSVCKVLGRFIHRGNFLLGLERDFAQIEVG